MPFEKLKERWEREKGERAARAAALRHRLIERGKPVLEQYGVRKLILFGSVPDHRCHEGSDLDVLAIPLSGGDYWTFRRDLEDAVGVPIDLYTPDDDPVFVKKVLSRGDVVYEI